MPDLVTFRCLNCGEKFQVSVLTKEEEEKARLSGELVGQIVCPECKRSSYRKE